MSLTWSKSNWNRTKSSNENHFQFKWNGVCKRHTKKMKNKRKKTDSILPRTGCGFETKKSDEEEKNLTQPKEDEEMIGKKCVTSLLCLCFKLTVFIDERAFRPVNQSDACALIHK